VKAVVVALIDYEYIERVVVFAGMCFDIALNSFPYTSSKAQVENAIYPPGFVTRIISFIATFGFGENIGVKLNKQMILY